MANSTEEEKKINELNIPTTNVVTSISMSEDEDVLSTPSPHNAAHLTQIEIQKKMGKPDNIETVNVVNKYTKKPCKRFWYNLIGWVSYFTFWLFALIGCVVIGPFFFAAIKIRYIANNMVWESLISQILTEEDYTYGLRKFPYPCKCKT